MKKHPKPNGVRKFDVEHAVWTRPDVKHAVWTRLGTVVCNSENNFLLKLVAIPAPVDGQYQIVLVPAKRKSEDKK